MRLRERRAPLIRRIFHSPRPQNPIFVFCYHKCGTVLLAKTFSRICARFGWQFAEVYGLCTWLPRQYDVVLLSHSLIKKELLARPYVGVHLVRDPRDIIVSGYLYHSRCSEPWCTSTDLDLHGDLIFPKIPTFMATAAVEKQVKYLQSLNGKSYQENLRCRSQEEAILFEMEGYSGWTIRNMMDWDYGDAHIFEIKFEDMLTGYCEVFARIFAWFNFTEGQKSAAMELAEIENYSSMSNAQKRANPHISSGRISKWQSYFTEKHKRRFRELFGTVLQDLGYEKDDNW